MGPRQSCESKEVACKEKVEDEPVTDEKHGEAPDDKNLIGVDTQFESALVASGDNSDAPSNLPGTGDHVLNKSLPEKNLSLNAAILPRNNAPTMMSASIVNTAILPRKVETEMSLQGEAGLDLSWEDCAKNNGHEEFVPIADFDLKHLPPGCHWSVYCGIMLYADFTVNIKVRHVSADRPSEFPGSNIPYYLHNLRGKDILHVGTGWVWDVVKTFSKDKTPQLCPCSVCEESGSPVPEWGGLVILTAAHLIYDDAEARKATCEFFFDRKDPLPGKVKTVYGVGVSSWGCDPSRDWCGVNFVTHDMEFWKRLKEMRSHMVDYVVENKDGQGRRGDSNKLVVIISHPHGLSKHITVGEWTRKIHVDGDSKFTQYMYTTPTCSGCSGAPVFLPGRRMWIYATHLHNGDAFEEGINQSGVNFY